MADEPQKGDHPAAEARSAGPPPPAPSVRDLSRRARDLFLSIEQHMAEARETMVALGRAEIVIHRLRDLTAIARSAANDDERRDLAEQYETLRGELEKLSEGRGMCAPAGMSATLPHCAHAQTDLLEAALDQLDQRLSVIQSTAGPLIDQMLLLQIRRAIALAGQDGIGRPPRPSAPTDRR